MKKLTLAALGIVALGAIVACSDTNDKAQAVTSDKARTNTPTGDAPVANSPVDADPTPETSTGGKMDSTAKQN